MFNLKKCKNLNEISWDGCTYYDCDGKGTDTDTGGETAEYLEKYYEDKNLIKIIEITHIGDNLDETLIPKLIVDNKQEQTLCFLKKLKENSGIVDKEFCLFYNNYATILHLRRSTWSDSYLKNKEIVDNFLKNN